MMNANNPVLNAKTISNLRSYGPAMTLDGAVFKSGVLLLIACATAAVTWSTCADNPAAAWPWMIGGSLGAFVMAMVIFFKKEWSPVLAPAYAALEGCFLGAVSMTFNARYQGIALNAALLTLGTLAVMLALYRFRIIRATEKFRAGVFAATGAIALVYLVSMVMGFFGKSMPFLHDSGPLGIGINLFIVGIAALNLILDFNLIESAAAAGVPAYMEWYCGFSLLVTIVWLYLEMLRLLSKFSSRR